MADILRSGGVVLPAPVSISVNDKIIWTSDTGRTMDGTMVGDPVANKKTVSIKWGVLPESDVALIKRTLVAGFFPFTFRDDGINVTIEVYRGTISKEQIGRLGDGIFWYRSVTVDIIQR